jgi:2-dehydropantoate 2-reductase
MGSLFASQLHRAGCPTTLLLRNSDVPAAVRLTVARGANRHRVEMSASTAADTGRISHLLVTTKAQDVENAVLSVSHRLDRTSQVVLLANGLGYDQQLRRRLPEPDYYQGTTTAGAYLCDSCEDDEAHPGGEGLGHRHVHHAGIGPTRIGQPGRAAPPAWFGLWAQAIQSSAWDPDIEQALWLKLAINCAINPLTALHGCRNGELAGAKLAQQLADLCHEIMQISAAAGFADITNDLPGQVASVVRATADNRSSMLQDLLAKRPTEIEFITGYLLRVAKSHALAAPINHSLYRSIVNRAE